jgi:hypothetical protein
MSQLPAIRCRTLPEITLLPTTGNGYFLFGQFGLMQSA